MVFNHFPNLEGTLTLWDVTDPYLVDGMLLVDLVDLLNLTGDGLGPLGVIYEFSPDYTLS